MLDFNIRCSALGGLMTEPQKVDPAFCTPEVEAIVRKTKRTDEEKALIASLKDKSLSQGAKTQVRMLVREWIFGFDNEVSSKEMEKGIEVESDAIQLVSRVLGLDLQKNTERRTDFGITGECDICVPMGRDIKCPWSLASFPICQEDAEDSDYYWQAQGYMLLWDQKEWSIDYVMMPTPERLIRYEPRQLHEVSHLPEYMRVTTWTVKRDPDAIRLIRLKVDAARKYAKQVMDEFDRTHKALECASLS